MGWEEEIISLLKEIKEQQKNHYEEWRNAIADSKKAAEESRKAAKKGLRLILIVIIALVILLFLITFAGSLSRLFLPGRCGSFSYLQNSNYFEAKDWLNENKNAFPLASNRFNSKEDALKFVDNLYKNGAQGVYVINVYQDSRTIKDENGPYADTLVVKLPPDKDNRKKLFDIYTDETKREGFDTVSDFGQSELLFWWD